MLTKIYDLLKSLLSTQETSNTAQRSKSKTNITQEGSIKQETKTQHKKAKAKKTTHKTNKPQEANMLDKKTKCAKAIKQVDKISDKFISNALRQSETKEMLHSQDALEKLLLSIDNIAVNLDSYPQNMLYDINAGHWDIYQTSETTEGTGFQLKKSLIARSPLLDVKNGTIAIDFGTKSTTAAILDDKNQKQLLRIGGGSYKKAEHKNDYENPTIIEFVDIDKFMQAYHQTESRPLTSWDDICVSHTARNHLIESNNEDFYRFFSSLKQWARSSGNTINITDAKKSMIPLKDFLNCEGDDINPIEIYAYYIGRYINNMTRGIYLDYLLSFPTKYKKDVRDKIQQSFERGLKKSIPALVLQEKDINVKLQASEPAAYAISALKEYGFATGDLKEIVHYGVFDFGGGTTDFDFGMWQLSENRRYDFDITHFGAGGDQYLGGENLLERLAFEVFKKNQAVMRDSDCSFLKPDNMSAFGGSENLISTSSEARKNTSMLVEYLRPVWENISTLLPTQNENGEIEVSSDENIQDILSGTINIQLVDNTLKSRSVALSINADDLIKVLRDEIKRGVDNFLHSFKNVASKMKDLKKLRIFLAGNSSRSPLVKECFEEMIKNESKNSENVSQFEILLPLGTPEAKAMQKAMGINVVEEQDLSIAVTCKTGVVFGLLDSRKGGRIQVISEIAEDDEAKFEFYLGMEKIGKFKTLLEIDEIAVGSDEWYEIYDYADMLEYEILYTADARATTNEMSIQEAKRMTIRLDKEYGEEDRVKIQVKDVDTITYEVFDKSGQKLSNINKTLKFMR